MGYWGKVTKRAVKQALGEVRWDSPVRVVTGICVPLATILILYRTTRDISWSGLVTLALVFGVFLFVFAVNLFKIPAAMDREASIALAALEDALAAEQAARQPKPRDPLQDELTNWVRTHLDPIWNQVAALHLHIAMYRDASSEQLRRLWIAAAEKEARRVPSEEIKLGRTIKHTEWLLVRWIDDYTDASLEVHVPGSGLRSALGDKVDAYLAWREADKRFVAEVRTLGTREDFVDLKRAIQADWGEFTRSDVLP
jgi:hypothetical protein